MFITLEGMEGCGKSTQAKLLAEALATEGRAYLLTREPGGSALGQAIRHLLVEGRPEDLNHEAELFLYLADRAQHVDRVLKPALKQKKIVLCDRFSDSTLAYQGYGRGLDLKQLTELNRQASQGLSPNLTFLLDCPPELGLARSQKRLAKEASAEGRFEQETLNFHQRVREGFLQLAKAEPARFVVVDATHNPQDLHQLILQKLKKLF